MPRDFEDDENPCLLELGALDLELTDEQRDMLRPPEERIKEIQFPRALQDRVKMRRAMHRKNKWASKFRGQFAGKLQAKWNKAKLDAAGRGALESKSRGVGKVKRSVGRPAKTKSTFSEKLKAKQKGECYEKMKAEKKEKEGLELCKDSPWHGTSVRVTEEGVHEGRHGNVHDVWRIKNCEGEFILGVHEAKTAAIFQIPSSQARGPTGRAR